MAPNETKSKVRTGDESPLSTTPHPTTATTTPSVVKKTQLCATLSTGMLVASFAVLMPFYQSRRDEFGCDPSCYGRYTSARSFLGLIGGLICGRLSDLFGRRTMLQIGILAALTGLTLSYNTTDVTGLYLAMIPGSLFQQNFSVTKALFADLCNEHGLPDDTRGTTLQLVSTPLAFTILLTRRFSPPLLTQLAWSASSAWPSVSPS